MKVVLQDRVANLGIAGDIVIVKDGYARNFLIPQGLAKFADQAALNEAEALRAKAEQAEVERLAKMEEQLKAVEGKSVTIERKADDNGSLFGSVSAKDVLDRINEGGSTFTEADLSWEAKKEVGEYEATLWLDSERNAKITINITEETE